MIKQTIGKIWRDELCLDQIEDNDDFFAVGGHSLIMAKIQARIRREIGVTVPMDELFRHASIGRIADHIATLRGVAPAAPPPDYALAR